MKNGRHVRTKWKWKEFCTKWKCEGSENDIYNMMYATQKRKSEVKEMYSRLRKKVTPCQKTCRNMDACTIATAESIKLIRLTEDEEEFDAEAERHRLGTLLDCNYTRSIYGSTVSIVTVRSHRSGHHSEIQNVSAKRANTVAELAAKKAEIEMQAAIDAHRQLLRDLESQRDRKVIEVKVKAYSIETPTWTKKI